ncbi:MAG: hypothetical protein H6Q21_1738, partial [Bacteroidetes bacterium]|nr:hypothetical protein [Bacteroidota bacterium]
EAFYDLYAELIFYLIKDMQFKKLSQVNFDEY